MFAPIAPIPGLAHEASSLRNDVGTLCEMADGIAFGIADGSLDDFATGSEEEVWIRRRLEELAATASDDATRQLVATLRADLAARDAILELADLTRRGEFPP